MRGEKNGQDAKSPRDLISEEAPLDPLGFLDLVISVFTASHGEETNPSTGMLSLERRTPASAGVNEGPWVFSSFSFARFEVTQVDFQLLMTSLI